jgi:hypothetical protein
VGILSGMGEGGWGLLAGWIVPAAIAVVVSMLLIFPSDLPLMDEFTQLDGAERTLILAFASVAIGFVLSAAKTQLYRPLEGYLLWPRGLAEGCATRQLEKKRRLERELKEGNAQIKPDAIHAGLLAERLKRYPAAEDQVAPTALGNAIRAFETYGADRYQLDSQILWYELVAVAPDSLQKELERARVPTDFSVATFFLLILFGLLSLIAGIAQSTDRLLLLTSAAVAFAALPAWYWLAVNSVADWGASAQTLVNVSRGKLATEMGLEIPETIEEEREMWREVSWYVGWPNDEERRVALNRFRAKDRPFCCCRS